KIDMMEATELLNSVNKNTDLVPIFKTFVKKLLHIVCSLVYFTEHLIDLIQYFYFKFNNGDLFRKICLSELEKLSVAELLVISNTVYSKFPGLLSDYDDDLKLLPTIDQDLYKEINDELDRQFGVTQTIDQDL